MWYIVYQQSLIYSALFPEAKIYKSGMKVEREVLTCYDLIMIVMS